MDGMAVQTKPRVYHMCVLGSNDKPTSDVDHVHCLSACTITTCEYLHSSHYSTFKSCTTFCLAKCRPVAKTNAAGMRSVEIGGSVSDVDNVFALQWHTRVDN